MAARDAQLANIGSAELFLVEHSSLLAESI